MKVRSTSNSCHIILLKTLSPVLELICHLNIESCLLWTLYYDCPALKWRLSWLFFPSPILYLLDKPVKKIALMAIAITAALSLFLRRAVLWLNKRLTEAQVQTVAPQTSLPVSLATLGDLHEVTASSRRKLGRQESCLHFSIVLLPHLTINKTQRSKPQASGNRVQTYPWKFDQERREAMV